jgi:hypothetical protein
MTVGRGSDLSFRSVVPRAWSGSLWCPMISVGLTCPVRGRIRPAATVGILGIAMVLAVVHRPVSAIQTIRWAAARLVLGVDFSDRLDPLVPDGNRAAQRRTLSCDVDQHGSRLAHSPAGSANL